MKVHKIKIFDNCSTSESSTKTSASISGTCSYGVSVSYGPSGGASSASVAGGKNVSTSNTSSSKWKKYLILKNL